MSTALALVGALAALTSSASTVRLPAQFCGTQSAPTGPELFRDGFEEQIPSNPSNGSGGAFPGSITRTIAVSGVGNRDYYLRLPPDYAPSRSWPVLLVLHGAGGPGTSPANAAATRDDWAATADARRFIVAAPASNGAQGGWGVTADFAMLNALIADLEASYNIERTRYSVWGFSAGAHFAHGLVLDNTDFFAAYAVSAGALHAYACEPGTSGQFACVNYLPAVARKLPVAIYIGTGDPLYPTTVGDPARLLAAGWSGSELAYREFAGGHEYRTEQLPAIWDLLCPYAVVP